jgi:hypothetical protein
MNKILVYSMASARLIPRIPTYYEKLNEIWREIRPKKLKRYAGNIDLVLTSTYDIALPDIGVTKETQQEMVRIYSNEIIPVFEIYKREFEYKKIQIMLEWKRTELRHGPPPKLKYTHDKLVELTNDQEIRNYILDQEPIENREQLRLEYFELQDEIDILNTTLETYDTVVYLDVHGLLLEEEPVDDVPTIDFGLKIDKYGYCIPGKYPVCVVPESSDTNFTFITATKPGVNNIEELSIFFRQFEAMVNKQLIDTKRIDILKLQKDVRRLKKYYIERINSMRYTPKEKLEKFQGSWDKFERDKGWGITKNKWLNKKLIPDLKFGIPIRILYDQPGKTPLDNIDLFGRILQANGRNQHALRSDKELFITTNELVQYLIDAGRKNVLIIDTSCFEQRLYEDLRTERRLVREAKKQEVTSVDGGTRKKNKNKRKTRRKR